ncbi:MAG: SpoIIE family protein phosphatase [Candidatus Promineofilum sp.]|nr:SpoIIE family protein phosphatase [Promineifilum sp.]
MAAKPLPAPLLSSREMAWFATEERLHLPAGATVIREGEPGDTMFVLVQGELSVTVKGKPIDYLLPGSVLGEMAMLDSRSRSATAVAVSAVELVRFDRARFLELVRQRPEFAAHIMNIMSVRTRRLMEEEVKRQRMEEELVIGRRIQLSLLPRGCPQVTGYQFAAGYRAAHEVGGDLYDFIVPTNDPSTVHLVIADVTGKGVPAALYMAVSRTLLHSYACDGYSPGEALRRVNDFIRQDAASPLLLSAFYAVLDADIGRLTYANAGHNAPIHLRAATGEMELLQSRGLLLGAFATFLPDEQTCSLEPGDFVVFFTDGITEARNGDGGFFDDEGLEAVVRSQSWSSAEELVSAIVSAVDTFAAGAAQADDFTVVVLQRLPPA